MDLRQFKVWTGKLGRQNFKDVLVFLLFLVFSALFWIVFTLSEVHESTIQVELKLTDVPRNVIITEPLPSTIQVQIQDRGMTFLHYKMRGINTLEIPYAGVAGKDEGSVQVSMAEVQRLLRSNLMESSKVLKILPESLEYWYSRGDSKVVPLKLAGQVTPGNGYLVTSVSLSPHTVAVTAPKQILDTLAAVYTMPTGLANLQSNRTETLKICPIRGAMFDRENAEVKASVDVLVENSVVVPIQIDGLPENKSLRLFPTSNATVVYSSGYTKGKDIKPEDFAIHLSYDRILELQRQGLGKIPLKLTSKPSSVFNFHLTPSEVDYVIQSTGEQEE